MKVLLVSDANVVIDIERGKLTPQFFRLPYSIAVPDVLFEEELQKRHEHLLNFGLEKKILKPEFVVKIVELSTKYRKTSRNDLFALALALQEQATLLTGDKSLREAAHAEQVTVHGTIWIVIEMVKHKLITTEEASTSFALMNQSGGRLPKGKIHEELEKIK